MIANITYCPPGRNYEVLLEYVPFMDFVRLDERVIGQPRVFTVFPNDVVKVWPVPLEGYGFIPLMRQ